MSGLTAAAAAGAAAVLFALGFAAGRASTRRTRRILHWQSTHDALTALPNRSGLDRTAAALLSAGEPGRAAAALLVDLDGFKAVNDAHGHPAGDQVLRIAAARLREIATAAGGYAGRRGGDEFAVIVPDLPAGRAGRDVAAELATAVHHALAGDYPLLGRLTGPVAVSAAGAGAASAASVRVGASVGAGVADHPHRHGCAGPLRFGQLLAAADAAMYAAKRSGGGASVRGADRLPGVVSLITARSA